MQRRCMVTHGRLFANYMAFLFYTIGGVVLISAHFVSEELDPRLFTSQKTVLLASGIGLLILAIISFLAIAFTTRILRTYVPEDDWLFEKLWKLLALDKQEPPAGPSRDDFDSNSNSDSFLTPEPQIRDRIAIAEKPRAEIEKLTQPQEHMSEVIVAKLPAEIDVKDLALKDPSSILEILKMAQIQDPMERLVIKTVNTSGNLPSGGILETRDGETFLFTSESVGEGHPGKY